MAKRDYYEVLGVNRDASNGDLKRAYRKLAYDLHPDRNPGDSSAEEKFKEAAEAYEVLSDSQKRSLYDRFGHDGVRRSGGAGFSGFTNVEDIFSHFGDIFSDMFGFGGFGGPRRRRRGGPARGADLRYDLQLDFLDVVEARKEEIEVQTYEDCDHCEGKRAEPGTSMTTCGRCQGRGQVVQNQGIFMLSTTCPTCRGQGQTLEKPCTQCHGAGRQETTRNVTLDVPAGVDDGVIMRLRGRGAPGEQGGPPGDLHVVIHVSDHPEFIRRGYDVHARLPINFLQAALGHKTTIETVHGEADISVPRGTQPGDEVKLKGKGFPRLAQDGKGKGNHVAHIEVVVPEDLTPHAEELLKELAGELGVEINPVKKKRRGKIRSFFDSHPRRAGLSAAVVRGTPGERTRCPRPRCFLRGWRRCRSPFRPV